jgi:hypothetical protein
MSLNVSAAVARRLVAVGAALALTVTPAATTAGASSTPSSGDRVTPAAWLGRRVDFSRTGRHAAGVAQSQLP